MRFTTKLLPSRSGNVGIFLLNNPQTFHALSLDMIHCFQDVLAEWLNDDTMEAILLKSSQAKRPAFCAGGDVKQVYLSGVNEVGNHGIGHPGLATAEFFRQEYCVNYLLATNESKPQVSFWDGIVMGGGVGISVHGKYRIATENTLFSMPETAIGLFPDVGSMFWMPRILSPSLATYLALTGQRLKAHDLLETGIATHYVPSARLPELEKALVDDSSSVAPILMSFHEDPPSKESVLKPHQSTIDDIFGYNKSLNEIVSGLNEDSSEFAKQTLDTIQKMSPTSMRVTLEGLKRGAQFSDIGQDLRMEYRMSQAFMREGSDFYEGIRAVLIDKDHAPRWREEEQLSDDMIQSFFEPMDYEWEPPVARK